MRATTLVLAFFAAMLASHALAEEQVEVCAQYSATGKSYHVDAISATGSGLNVATNSFRYYPIYYCSVILWAQNGASVTEMKPPFFGSFSMYGGYAGTDQNGRNREISYYLPALCGF